jgi:hypothetical protein
VRIPEKLKTEGAAKAKPPIVHGGSRDEETRAIELILKHGLQRLLNSKR